MAFLPPQFKDFGKKVGDLLKKGYDFKNEFKSVNTSAQGVKIETSAVNGKELVGNCKITHSDKNLNADLEVNVSTGGCASATNAKVTLNKLIPKVNKLSVSGNADSAVTLEAIYSHDFFAGSLTVSRNKDGKTKLKKSGAIGYDGVAVGGDFSCDLADPSKFDFNCGAEYAQKDFIASLVTSNQGDDVTTSFFQKVSPGFTLGTKLVIESEAGKRSLTVGSEYAMDKSTTLKTSINSGGVINASVAHILANPACKLNISAQFDALGGDVLKANKMGVGITVGEF
jgi:hypothetical protein